MNAEGDGNRMFYLRMGGGGSCGITSGLWSGFGPSPGDAPLSTLGPLAAGGRPVAGKETSEPPPALVGAKSVCCAHFPQCFYLFIF